MIPIPLFFFLAPFSRLGRRHMQIKNLRSLREQSLKKNEMVRHSHSYNNILPRNRSLTQLSRHTFINFLPHFISNNPLVSCLLCRMCAFRDRISEVIRKAHEANRSVYWWRMYIMHCTRGLQAHNPMGLRYSSNYKHQLRRVTIASH